MSWVARRRLLLAMAEIEPGWGCVRLVGDRHIGRVLMGRKYGHQPGLYLAGRPVCQFLDGRFAADQKHRTTELPK